jgi:hypothetical protein
MANLKTVIGITTPNRDYSKPVEVPLAVFGESRIIPVPLSTNDTSRIVPASSFTPHDVSVGNGISELSKDRFEFKNPGRIKASP